MPRASYTGASAQLALAISRMSWGIPEVAQPLQMRSCCRSSLVHQEPSVCPWVGAGWGVEVQENNLVLHTVVRTHTHTCPSGIFFLQYNLILPLAILGNISRHTHQEKPKKLQECRRNLKEKKGVVAASAWIWLSPAAVVSWG